MVGLRSAHACGDWWYDTRAARPWNGFSPRVRGLVGGRPSYSRDAEKIIEFNGEKRSVLAWARHLGINKSSLAGRLKKGWPIHLALTIPIKRGQERPF